MHLFPSLGELIEAPGTEQGRVAKMLGLPGEATRKDFTNLFVVQLFPYASIYLSGDGKAGGFVRDEAAGYFRLVGASVPEEADHIAALLKWYGTLHRGLYGDYNTHAAGKELRHAFFWSTLGCWLPIYLLRARELGSALYKAWAEVTLDVLEAEAVQIGLPMGVPSGLQTTAVLPSVDDPVAFVNNLFIPVASGLLLCRADLGRCAQAHGLAVRVADRRQTLKIFLTENTAGVCGWLHQEALRQADCARTLPDALAPTREYWVRRAETTAQAIIDFNTRYAVGGRSISLG
jgi:TorA maturation chaperone TorD